MLGGAIANLDKAPPRDGRLRLKLLFSLISVVIIVNIDVMYIDIDIIGKACLRSH
jgi:hypothetical protein